MNFKQISIRNLSRLDSTKKKRAKKLYERQFNLKQKLPKLTWLEVLLEFQQQDLYIILAPQNYTMKVYVLSCCDFSHSWRFRNKFLELNQSIFSCIRKLKTMLQMYVTNHFFVWKLTILCFESNNIPVKKGQKESRSSHVLYILPHALMNEVQKRVLPCIRCQTLGIPTRFPYIKRPLR